MALTKVVVLKITNPVLAVAAAAQAVTGMMMSLFSESIPFGLVRQLHLYTGYILIALIIIHMVLNWTWVKSTFFRKKK
jgi:Domain of unknown function (DUF4405)